MALTEITNYIEDDWDDNALTSRTGATEGYFLHPSDNLLSGDYEAGDALKGVYRPEWYTAVGGSNISANNGQLEFDLTDTTNSRIDTNSDFFVGAWSFDFTWSNQQNDNGGLLLNMFGKGTGSNRSFDDGYSVSVQLDGDYVIFKYDSGSNTTLINTSGWGSDESTHTSKSTRDSYGNFELILDGTSQGTGTDTFLPKARRMGWGLGSAGSGSVVVDNLVVS